MWRRIAVRFETPPHPEKPWDSPLDTDPNTVEVYVGYLRRKLGHAALQTVRGVGYRLAS